MLANMKFLKADVRLIIDMSTSKKATYLNMNDIYDKMGESLCRALAVCHIFTGNDYNPSFFKKGKKRPFEILKKSERFKEAFNMLLNASPSQVTTDSNVFKAIEEFVCRMYSLKTKDDVNKGRFEMFEKKYKANKKDEILSKKQLKGFDASTLPPTKQTLLQQVKRTIYVSSIWCNAHLRSPTEFNAEDCGWIIIDDKYAHYWYDGPESPLIGELTLGMHVYIIYIFFAIFTYFYNFIYIFI